MCSFPMVARAVPEPPPPARAWLRGVSQGLGYGLLGLAIAALGLGLLQVLVGRRLMEQRQHQLGSELASRLLLAEVGLERFTPGALAEIGGMRLAVEIGRVHV